MRVIFIKEIENISPRLPIRYINTRRYLGELEIAWKHSLYTGGRARVPTHGLSYTHGACVRQLIL